MKTYRYSVLDLSVNSVYSFNMTDSKVIDKSNEKYVINMTFESSGSFLSGTNKIDILVNKKLFLSYKLDSLILAVTQDNKNSVLTDNPSLFEKIMTQLNIHFEKIKSIPDSYLDQRFVLMSIMIFELLGNTEDNSEFLKRHQVTEEVFLSSFDVLIQKLSEKSIKQQIYITVLSDFISEYRKNSTETVSVSTETVAPIKTNRKPNKKSKIITWLTDNKHEFKQVNNGYLVDKKKFDTLDQIIRQFKIRLPK